MKKHLPFLALMLIPHFIQANNLPSTLELDTCIRHIDNMSKNDINEMVVALHLSKKSQKYVSGTEIMVNNKINYQIISRSTSLVDKSLTKNVINIYVDEIKYACYPKS